MSYSGAEEVGEARVTLSTALEALQKERDIPEEVMNVAGHIAQAVGALFEAERASTEPDGKACTKQALELLSQTLTLLQDVKSGHPGIAKATSSIAAVMSTLYPLRNRPTMVPPKTAPRSPLPPPPSKAAKAVSASSKRMDVEANIGATTQSNFYVGFSSEISEGGVFLATYEALPQNTQVKLLVTLPGGYEFSCNGHVRFVRDPMDFNSDSEPGMGIQFEKLPEEARELVLRFIRKRPPMFYDV